MLNLSSKILLLLTLLITPIFCLAEVIGQKHANLAIEGYSPVSYFTKNIAEKGKAEFNVNFRSKTYYLTTNEQVLLFKSEPEKYIPQFGGSCPYSLLLGRQVAIDPTSFKIINDLLYLFHNSKELDALKEWNKKPDEQELLEKANGQFVLFEFD